MPAERWRQVATYRESDDDPKEQFVYHTAGMDGYGGFSYIDLVVLRDRDMDTDWDAEADGLDDRIYYCQNWRADTWQSPIGRCEAAPNTRESASSTRISALHTRMPALHTRMRRVHTRMRHIPTRMSARNTRMRGIQTRMPALHTRMHRIQTRTSARNTRMRRIPTRMVNHSVCTDLCIGDSAK